ncbi:lipopolysaccharide biosynthesis protein [Pantoea anthophila]|uniref:lipopolysaccharide biosynthesis protein n=1 Tax=Pantoea anthophila TaxID=470931 RepID=UPI002786893D|nr:lipopolysaccharide biosynthesis protein [Pantoea anthophila]MDQ1215017.1 O-antigen/teichoic acid export membrane protein [Pantoea anthophila]
MNVLSNAKWNAVSQFLKMLVQAVNLIYLAKIISPAQYGIMAMAVVVINLGTLLRDLGTSAALIQKKEVSNNLINSVFWLNVLLGLFLCGVIACLAYPLSLLYHQPELVKVLILLGLTFPLSSCAATHLALLERGNQFKSISRVEVTSSVCSVIIAIILANCGFGVYSLVAQALVQNSMSALQFWKISKWRPSLTHFIRACDIKEIFSFSTELSLYNFINYFSRNTDSFIIGRYMSATILGQYNLAYRIMLFPLQSMTYVATRSLYPVLSRFQDDNKRIEATYLNTIFFVLVFTAPLMTLIGYYSFPIIKLFFGEQWLKTAEILKWLAPTAIIQSVLSTTGAVFMVKNRTNIMLKLGMFNALIMVSTFFIGVRFDITTFAKFYMLANIFMFFPLMHCLMMTLSGNLINVFLKVYPVSIAVGVMMMAMFVIDQKYPSSQINNILLLVSICFCCVITYLVSLITMSKSARIFICHRLKIQS